MKTYEVVRELVKLMDDNQPKQKAILWDAFTKMFDLMVEEYEDRKYTAVIQKAADAAGASKVKATASPTAKAQPKGRRKAIDWPKAEACRKAGWDYAKIADELGCSYNSVYNHFNTKGATK